jgi:hypothetical protein
MIDQAHTLRQLMSQDRLQPSTSIAEKMVVFWGLEAQSGKTSLVKILSAMACRNGVRVGTVVQQQDSPSVLSTDSLFKDDELVFMDIDLINDEFRYSGIGQIRKNVLTLSPDSRNLRENLIRLKRLNGVSDYGVIVNQVRNPYQGKEVFKKLTASFSQTSSIEFQYLGYCLFDEKIKKALKERDYLLELYSGAVSLPGLSLLGRRLLDWQANLG